MGRRLILDTNVLIAYERGTIDRSSLDADELAIASVSVAEYRVGIELADSAGRAADRARALAAIMSAVDVLDYTQATAAHHGRLLAHVRRAGTPRGAHDLIIAAHAAETGRTILSRDAKARFGDLPGVSAIDALFHGGSGPCRGHRPQLLVAMVRDESLRPGSRSRCPGPRPGSAQHRPGRARASAGAVRTNPDQMVYNAGEYVETDIRVGANLRISRASAQPQIPAKVEVEEMSEQANVTAPATAGDIMRPPLTTVEQADHVAAAAYLMKHAGATAVTVLDPRTSEPVGIITEADIAHAVADGKDVNTTRIYELMTTRPTVIKTTTSVRDAAKVMTSGHFRHLPVMGDAGLVGIVDISDVCLALLESDFPQPPAGTVPSD